MKKILSILLVIMYVFSFGGIAAATEVTEAEPQIENAEIVEDIENIETEEVEIVDEEPDINPTLITAAYALKGTLYYCDTPTRRVVLKSLVPIFDTEGARAIAAAAEYLEIKVSADGIFMADGTRNSVDGLNVYADREVWVVIVEMADGNLEIPYFSFK